MALPQENRLRSSRDFSKVYRKGRRAATKNLAVRAFKTSKIVKSADGKPSALLLRSGGLYSDGPLFGISISRKVHKRAVVRNRIKRQLKAIIRTRFLAIAPEWQIVIVVRPSAVECSFDEFLRELEYLLQKLAVI
ncbi:MAG: ribonuclease P protein component [Cyanobacteria bacterium J06560_2]